MSSEKTTTKSHSTGWFEVADKPGLKIRIRTTVRNTVKVTKLEEGEG